MISTHILDTSKGMPAVNVEIVLEKKDEATQKWLNIGSGVTNNDGRFVFDIASEMGIYRLNFGIEAYFQGTAFFLDTPVVFQIKDINRKYHIPLLLNPYGYTTYRGS